MATLPKPGPLPDKIKLSPKLIPAKRVTRSVIRQDRTLSVSDAKTHLLSVLTDIETKGDRITITRRGRPVAQIVPFVETARPSGLGCMKGTFTITGDIVSPDHGSWGASSVWGLPS